MQAKPRLSHHENVLQYWGVLLSCCSVRVLQPISSSIWNPCSCQATPCLLLRPIPLFHSHLRPPRSPNRRRLKPRARQKHPQKRRQKKPLQLQLPIPLLLRQRIRHRLHRTAKPHFPIQESTLSSLIKHPRLPRRRAHLPPLLQNPPHRHQLPALPEEPQMPMTFIRLMAH